MGLMGINQCTFLCIRWDAAQRFEWAHGLAKMGHKFCALRERDQVSASACERAVLHPAPRDVSRFAPNAYNDPAAQLRPTNTFLPTTFFFTSFFHSSPHRALCFLSNMLAFWLLSPQESALFLPKRKFCRTPSILGLLIDVLL